MGLGADQIATAAGFWGLPMPSENSALATNNFAWRCGDVWLKATAAGRERRERSITILDYLEGFEGLSLPRALRTADGSTILEHAGLHWTAETAVAGVHPDPNSASDYFDAWAATGLLHEAFSSTSFAGMPSLVLGELRLQLGKASPESRWRNYAPIAQAAEILSNELDWMESWPAQAIHGDASHPNILLSAAGHGFIDFEFVSFDPIEFDFATLITTLLVRSTLDGQRREAILRDLIASNRTDPSRILLGALARRWLAAVANLNYDDGPNFDVLKRQMEHLSLFMPLTEKHLAASRVGGTKKSPRSATWADRLQRL